MNVFVLCTGRCGSTTFARACGHMSNFTAGHETRRHLHHPRFPNDREAASYPPGHVEVDNRLAWMLGTLDREYGKRAVYVHLLRDREQTARSFVNRWDSREANIVFAYAWGPLGYTFRQARDLDQDQRLDVARHYWNTVNDNIRMFLADKPHRHTVCLHAVRAPFEHFWRQIGAEGDLAAALAEWDVAHNPSVQAAPADPSAARIHALGAAPRQGTATPAATVPDAADADGAVPSPALAEAHAALEEALATHRAVDLDRYVPRVVASSWSLAPDALQLLTALLLRLRPRHVLELGSGLSTRLLLEASRDGDPACRVSSVDHDPEFVERTRASLTEDLQQRLGLQTAPVVMRRFGESHLPCYLIDRARLASSEPVGLCIIDGPPTGLGGREGTLYQVLSYCRPGSVVLVDDADRPRERQMLENWSTVLGDAVVIRRLPGFARGLAAVVVVEAVPPAMLWEHTLAVTAAEIQAAIPPDARVMLVDDYQWPDALAGRLPFRLQREPGSPPASAAEAVTTVSGLVADGVDFVVFARPAFWWLRHYAGLEPALDGSGPRVVESGRVLVWDVRGRRAGAGRLARG